jgi:hypothetical protein
MSSAPALKEYPSFLAALKERILHARTSAAHAVNHELVLLYWDIGCGIVEKQQTVGWGDAVVERLAADLRAEFPHVRGFSARSLWEMKRLYLAWSEPEFLPQAVAEIRRTPTKPAILPQAVAEIGESGTAVPTAPENPSEAIRELVAACPWGHYRINRRPWTFMTLCSV